MTSASILVGGIMSQRRPQPIGSSSEPPDSSRSPSMTPSFSQWLSETSSVAQSFSGMTLSPSPPLYVTTSSSEWSTRSSSSTPTHLSVPHPLTVARPFDSGVTVPFNVLHLPREILQHIFSFLSRRDLLQATFVNKWCSQNGNPILYQHLDLSSDDPHVCLTLDILMNPPTLSKGIVHARLTTRAPSRPRNPDSGTPWIQPDFFQLSTNLRSLHLRGCPFLNLQQWQTFGQTLQRFCINLVDIHFEHMADDLLVGEFPLSGLTRLSWHPESGTSHVRSPYFIS